MKVSVSAEEFQKAATLYSRGVAMSQSPEKKYTAEDMIEFGLTCSLVLPKEDVEELRSSAIIMALVAYDETKGQLNGHS